MELIFYQLTSLVVFLFIGLMLALSRVHMSSIVRRYELSRWMIVCAMGIFAVHYLLQIVYGFRESGDDVGAVVNVLFYAPVAYLLSFAIVNLSSGSKYMKRHILFSIVSYLVILVTFIAGISVHKSLHVGFALYLMGVEYFVSILFCVINPYKESLRIRSELERDTASDLRVYNKFLYTGTMVLLATSLLTPGIIFSRGLLFIIGPVLLLSIFAYGVNFLCLGFNLRPVADVLEEQDKTAEPDPDMIEMPDDVQVAIKNSLDSWIAKGGFANPDVTLTKLAKHVGCSSTDLGHFISNSFGVTFRVWLSKVRIEEAKRVLVEKPDLTIEAIADDCGFSSRSYFQNLFKAETGFTPKEWRSKM